MSELREGWDGARASERSSPGLDAVARAELRRSRQAVFGPGVGGGTPAFAERIARAVGDRTEFGPVVPAPNGPSGSAALPAVPRPLPAPHEVVAAPPRRDQPTPGLPGVLGGPESVPLPNAPALVCDGADRIVRVNPALLALAGRTAEAGAGLFGMRLPQLVVGPDTDARLVRPDGALVRVRVLRWDVPGRELRAVVLVELGGATGGDEREAGRRWVAELERMASAGTWSYELATGSLRRSASLEELYRSLGLDRSGERAAPESDQVARLCQALRTGRVAGEPDHHVELELPGGHLLDCRAEVEFAPDGTPVRLVGAVRDIGAERAAQTRVERSGQRFADLVAVLPGGVAMIDPGGRIVEVNPALATLLATPADELRGRPIAAVAVDPSGERLAGAFPEWLRLVRPGARHGYTVESVPLQRGDGDPAWCDLSVSVSTTDDGGWFWLVVCTDLAEQHRAAEELRRAAHVDALTGLPTSAAMLELVDRMLAGPGRGGLAVVCVGIDDFDRVNSALGHAAGDEVLASLAQRLRDELPGGCRAARLSGDEFVVVCADHRVAGGPTELARGVADALTGGVLVDGHAVRLTASAGVAAGVVGRQRTAVDLLRYAQVAMQDAQRSHGRGGVAVATEEMVDAAAVALELELGLRAVLTGDGVGSDGAGLILHYQPVVSPDGIIRSAEALVRWQHPTRGMISPAEFLPVAQRCGLGRELDVRVLRTACHEAARWPAHDGEVVDIAVNLAGLLPDDPEFLDVVTEAVAASGLAWNRLILELVETSLVQLPPHAAAVMAELVARGVRFAVDDFGTGYSGLGRLKDVPAQIVKLDRSFVAGIHADPTDRTIARIVLDLARALGCAVVAEGVETADQYRALRELGVESFQGWLFARALPAPQLRALLVGDRLPIPHRDALGD